jgi:hypothetical protein
LWAVIPESTWAVIPGHRGQRRLRCWPLLYLLFRAFRVKLFPVLLLPFAQGLALEFEPMSGTQETIQQSISHGRDP